MLPLERWGHPTLGITGPGQSLLRTPEQTKPHAQESVQGRTQPATGHTLEPDLLTSRLRSFCTWRDEGTAGCMSQPLLWHRRLLLEGSQTRPVISKWHGGAAGSAASAHPGHSALLPAGCVPRDGSGFGCTFPPRSLGPGAAPRRPGPSPLARGRPVLSATAYWVDGDVGVPLQRGFWG